MAGEKGGGVKKWSKPATEIRMLNLIQILLAVALAGYIFIGHWDALPHLTAIAWDLRGVTLLGWCHLYVVLSALLAVRFHSDKISQFWPLLGWNLGIVWTTNVIFTLPTIIIAQLFLFTLTPDGIFLPLIVNIVGGSAGIFIGNIIIIGYNYLTVALGVFWVSSKNPFFLELRMLNVCDSMKIIPPTDRATKWPAKATISLMVGYETMMDWGWV